jgi:hypothetical protein
MHYNIKIRLPKKNIRQFALENQNVSDMSFQEFDNLISKYQNHIALSKDLSKLESKQIIWNPTSDQLNYLANYYSQNAIGFADSTIEPGRNNTFNIQQGIIYLAQINQNLTSINNSYERIGMQPIPFVRLQEQNVKLPNLNNINAQYIQERIDPDPETFGNILKELIAENKLTAPITYNQYKALTPKFYLYNNVLYNLPNHKVLDVKTSPYNIAFYKVRDEHYGNQITIERFEDNFEAWTQYLIDNKEDMSHRTFNSIREKYPVYPSPLTGQPIHYYTYNNSSYFFIPSSNELTDTLTSYYHDIVVSGRPSTNSIGNKVLQKIRNESTIQDLLPEGYTFKTEFKCQDDPRYNEFIQEQIDKGRGQNMFLYLMSSIKNRKTIKKTENGKNLHCINLRTEKELFENIPFIDEGYIEKYNSGEIHEFELDCNKYSFEEKTCVEWNCTTYTPLSDGGINMKRTTLKKANFMPARYSFDAVIVDQNNNVKLVLEFDGSDHYIARKGNTVANKLVSDQVKENFCDKVKGKIKTIRIPYFSSHKPANFETEFETYVVDIIKKYLGVLDNSETTNTNNYEKSPE